MDKKITEIAESAAQKLKLSIWDITLEKEGSDIHLTFYIDTPGGITSDDCESFSRLVDPLLEEIGAFETADYLDVSSPGLGRKLKTDAHFMAYIGHDVTVKLYKAVGGAKEFSGILDGYSGGNVTISGTEYDAKAYAYVKLNDDLNLF